MKKNWTMILLALILVLSAVEVFAEGADPLAVQRENALAAAKVSLPEAEFDYTVRERDDGRYEWNLFFKQGESLGICKVLEEKNEVRRVEMFPMPQGALKASEAMARLAQEKGAIVIVDLDLDHDDGALRYEGAAELDGKRYEFEMLTDGKIIEWERD